MEGGGGELEYRNEAEDNFNCNAATPVNVDVCVKCIAPTEFTHKHYASFSNFFGKPKATVRREKCSIRHKIKTIEFLGQFSLSF